MNLSIILFFWILGHSITMLYMTVFYHRYLSHKSFQVSPWLHRFILHSGSIATGINPIGWVCMHRLHHRHSDTLKDPHSPRNLSAPGLLVKQLKQYKIILQRLMTGKEEYVNIVRDINYPDSVLNSSKHWYFPYIIQLLVSFSISISTQSFLNGFAFLIGISAHPIHGFIVNYYCHKFGKKTFETGDDSRNSLLFGLLLYGEGHHNNHHHNPKRVSFSRKWYEIDLGYLFIRLLNLLGFAKFN